MLRSALVLVVLAGCTAAVADATTTPTATRREPGRVQSVRYESSASHAMAPTETLAPSAEPARPPPLRPTYDPRCAVQDGPALCQALVAMLDVGDVLASVERVGCRDAAASLERYADINPDTLAVIDAMDNQPAVMLGAFRSRHRRDLDHTLARATELDTRCARNHAVAAALRRLRFRL